MPLGGDEVFTKKSTDLCLQECFAFSERFCALFEDFGLVTNVMIHGGHMTVESLKKMAVLFRI